MYDWVCFTLHKERIVGRAARFNEGLLVPHRETPDPPLNTPLRCYIRCHPDPQKRLYFAQVLPLMRPEISKSWRLFRRRSINWTNVMQTDGGRILMNDHDAIDQTLPVLVAVQWVHGLGWAEVVDNPLPAYVEKIDVSRDRVHRLLSERDADYLRRLRIELASLIRSGKIVVYYDQVTVGDWRPWWEEQAVFDPYRNIRKDMKLRISEGHVLATDVSRSIAKQVEEEYASRLGAAYGDYLEVFLRVEAELRRKRVPKKLIPLRLHYHITADQIDLQCLDPEEVLQTR